MTQTTSKPPSDSLRERVSERAERLTPAERRAVEYMQEHPVDVVFASATEIAKRAGVSDATVVRAAKSLGYSGLPELRRSLGAALTRARPSTLLHQRITTTGHEPLAVLDRVFEEATEALGETHRSINPEAFERAVVLLKSAHACLTFGVGVSQTVADYLARRLTRAGVPSRSGPLTGFDLADSLLPLAKNDVVVVFAPGRLLHEIDVLVDHSRSVGASVMLVTDSLGPVLGPRVDATLMAVLSPSGMLGETMVPTMLVDALVLALAASQETRAVRTSEVLTNLRAAILR